MVVGRPPFQSESRNKLYTSILTCQLDFPIGKDGKGGVSEVCINLIKELLVTDPKERLGCGVSGIKKLKNHMWFKHLDFDLLEQKKLKPPFIPTSRDINEKKFFDQNCISAHVDDSILHQEFDEFPKWSFN